MTDLEVLERQFRPIDIDHPEKYSGASGVYMVVDEGCVLYVGASSNLVYRIQEFERLYRGMGVRGIWYPLPAKVLPFYEGTFIRALRPENNKACPSDAGFDDEILTGFGLPSQPSPGHNARLWREELRRRRSFGAVVQ